MTRTLSTAALRMPHAASVAAPAPLASGVSAEPRAPIFGGHPSGTGSSDRFGGITRPEIEGGWQGQDQAQLAGGGPLRE